jgi:hypothetical protein
MADALATGLRVSWGSSRRTRHLRSFAMATSGDRIVCITEGDDPLAMARATLGVQGALPPVELRRRFLALVRRWHPDRFAADPAAQARANRRLREAIQAYKLVSEHDRGVRAQPLSNGPWPVVGRYAIEHDEPGGRLAREEIDAIAQAIGTASLLDVGFALMGWSWPLWIAAAILFDPRVVGPVGAPRLIGVAALAVLALVLHARRRRRVMSGRPAAGRAADEVHGEFDWHRLISGAYALAWIGLVAAVAGSLGAFRTACALVLPLACIWFPDGMTAGSLLAAYARPSPPFLLRVFGWLALLALTIGEVIAVALA